MRGIESTVIRSFIKAVSIEALRRRVRFAESSLDAQDRWAFADHLFYSETNFALVEFKSGAGDVYYERRKDFIGELCERIYNDKYFHRRSSQHHFMVWYNHKKDKFVVNNYAACVCDGIISFINQIYPFIKNGKGPYSVLQFCDMLFSRGETPLLDLVSFSSYLRALTRITDKKQRNIAILHYNYSKREGGILSFKSIDEAYLWFLSRDIPRHRYPMNGNE